MSNKVLYIIKKYFPLSSLIFLTLSFVLKYFVSDYPRISLLCLIVSALLILSFLVVEKNKVLSFLKINKTQKGINSLVSFVFFIFILAGLNYVLSNHDFKHDFTRNKVNSLSEQSINVLKNLDKEVKIIAFVPSIQNEVVVELIKNYTYYSNKIKYELIDPSKDPIMARSFLVNKNNTFVVTSENNEAKFYDELSEENLTNSIIKVLRSEKKKVYFLSGHGEKVLSDETANGYSIIKSKLEGQNYDVEELNLLSKGQIPDDAKLLIIAGPVKPFFDKEKELISQYITNGLNIIMFLDPDLSSGAVRKNTLLDFALQNTGLSFAGNLIVDPSPALFGATATMPVVSDYSKAIKITENFEEKTFFPNAQSLIIAENEKITSTEFCKTSEKSWGEFDIKSGKVSFNSGVDTKGPLTLCAFLEGKADDDTKLNMIVVGDSDFINNQNADFVGNSDLFLNMASFLMKDNDLLSIRPKTQDVAVFSIGQGSMNIVAFATMYFIPLLVIVFGIVFWYRRRKL